MCDLKDHVHVEYSARDWPTTPEGEEEASTEVGVNDSNHMTVAGDVRVMVRARPPLGLLSVKMREHARRRLAIMGPKMGKYQRRGGSLLQVCPLSPFSIFAHPRS